MLATLTETVHSLGCCAKKNPKPVVFRVIGHGVGFRVSLKFRV